MSDASAQPPPPQTVQEYFRSVSRLPHSFYVLAFPQTHGDFIYYTPHEILAKADVAAANYLSQGLSPRNGADTVTAVLARGTIDWVITFVALLKLGHTALLLSPALPLEDISRLLMQSKAQTIIHDHRSTDISSLTGFHRLGLFSAPAAKSPAPTQDIYPWSVIPAPSVQLRTTPPLIIHSSGSTGHPKLIPKTQLELMSFLNSPTLIEANTSQCFYVSSGVYNAIGCTIMLNSFLRRAPTFFDNDVLPFTSQGYKQLLLEARPQKIWLTPYSLQLAASTVEGLWQLKTADEVLVVGAVCPQELGDRLSREGVRLSTNFGQQEIAPFASSSERPKDDLDWDYMYLNPLTKAHTEMRPMAESLSEQGEQYYELIVLKSHPLLHPRWVNTSDGDGYPLGSFRNGDIFLKHPSQERWKVVGRMDDQIKIYINDRSSIVNAMEYEHAILAEVRSVVEEVVLFGQGRKKLGLLVLPRMKENEEVVERAVWQAIMTRINLNMNTALERDMIVILPPTSLIPRTNKLNFIRPKVYERFAAEIAEAYG